MFTKDKMTRTINSVKDINLTWLQDTLKDQEEFIQDGILDLHVKPVSYTHLTLPTSDLV